MNLMKPDDPFRTDVAYFASLIEDIFHPKQEHWWNCFPSKDDYTHLTVIVDQPSWSGITMQVGRVETVAYVTINSVAFIERIVFKNTDTDAHAGWFGVVKALVDRANLSRGILLTYRVTKDITLGKTILPSGCKTLVRAFFPFSGRKMEITPPFTDEGIRLNWRPVDSGRVYNRVQRRILVPVDTQMVPR
jgi:hypothetical protein